MCLISGNRNLTFPVSDAVATHSEEPYHAARTATCRRAQSRGNAALLTKAPAELLVAKVNVSGHHAEVCELLPDETSTIHDSLVDIGEELPPPAAARLCLHLKDDMDLIPLSKFIYDAGVVLEPNAQIEPQGKL